MRIWQQAISVEQLSAVHVGTRCSTWASSFWKSATASSARACQPYGLLLRGGVSVVGSAGAARDITDYAPQMKESSRKTSPSRLPIKRNILLI